MTKSVYIVFGKDGKWADNTILGIFENKENADDRFYTLIDNHQKWCSKSHWHDRSYDCDCGAFYECRERVIEDTVSEDTVNESECDCPKCDIKNFAECENTD